MDARALELWLLILACGAGTYLWRGLGVLLSGRIAADSELFKWVACVAYAMVAGLIMRIMVMPTGLLAQSLLAERAAACAVALAVFYLARRNLLLAVAGGVFTLSALAYTRTL
jgi:branched-subunit amino acid transport protein